MQSTPVTVTYTLEDVLTRLEGKIDALQKDVTDIKITQAKMEAEIRGDIKVLDEKVNGLNKRLEFIEFINRGILIGLAIAVVGGVIRVMWMVINK